MLRSLVKLQKDKELALGRIRRNQPNPEDCMWTGVMNENSKGNLQQKVNTHRTPGYRVSAPEAGGRTGAQRDMRSVQRLPEHAVTNHCRWGAGRESSESTF